MSAKRVIVHTLCEGCHAPIPLSGLVTSATCGSCQREVQIDAGAWQWVLAYGDRTVLSGQPILGETRTGRLHCPACRAAVADAAVTQALAAGAAGVPCPSCHGHLPLRALPQGAERPAAWSESLCSAAIGEGAVAPLPTIACANCRAPVLVDGTAPEVICQYCGGHTPVPAKLEHQVAHRVHSFYVWTSPEAESAALSRVRRRRIAVRVGVAAAALCAIGGAAVVFGPKLIAALPHAPPRGIGTAGGSCHGMRWACSADHKSQLHCEGSRFVVTDTCKGPKGCRVSHDGDTIDCDYTLAAAYDPCDTHDHTCSINRHTELSCEDSHWVVSNTCRGKRGCRLLPEAHGGYMLWCDDSIAESGDPCRNEGGYACSADNHSVLQCDAGHFKSSSPCKGPKGCSATFDGVTNNWKIDCDRSIADVGDPCNKGNSACRSDRKAYLRCRNGHFYAAKNCPHSCTTPKSGPVECR